MNSPPFNFCVREALVCFSLINRFRKTQRPRVGKFIYYFSVSAFLKLAKPWKPSNARWHKTRSLELRKKRAMKKNRP